MMSTGARTVLISRWRPGGQSSYDLIREFVQELPEMTAADAWQRSIELVSRMPLDPTMEPRVKGQRAARSAAGRESVLLGGLLAGRYRLAAARLGTGGTD